MMTCESPVRTKLYCRSVRSSTSLLSHLYNLRTRAHTRPRNNAPILRNRTGLHNGDVKPTVLLVLRIPPVHEIDGKHAQVLVEELDIAIVDAPGNVLADLMGASALDHVEAGPAVLGLGARGGADEEVVFELALESIPLDVVGEGGGYFSGEDGTSTDLELFGRKGPGRADLGYPTPVKPDQPM
jgi:hypothetical protein